MTATRFFLMGYPTQEVTTYFATGWDLNPLADAAPGLFEELLSLSDAEDIDRADLLPFEHCPHCLGKGDVWCRDAPLCDGHPRPECYPSEPGEEDFDGEAAMESIRGERE